MLTRKISRSAVSPNFYLSEKISKKISSSIETWLRARDRIIVGIDGYSASRKTTIADYVAKHNRNLVVVHLDDFLKSSAARVKMMKSAKDRSKVFELKWYRYSVLDNLVKEWQTASPAKYRANVYDYDLKRVVTRKYNLSKPVLMIEGIFLFHPRHAISRKFDNRIYLSVDFHKADSRRQRREKKRFGKEYVGENHPDSFAKPFKVAYRRYYKKYHPEKQADLLFNI
jgi:uridine kinase